MLFSARATKRSLRAFHRFASRSSAAAAGRSPTTAATPPTLVWARLAASPLSEAGQGPAFAAIERAAAEMISFFERAATGKT